MREGMIEIIYQIQIVILNKNNMIIIYLFV